MLLTFPDCTTKTLEELRKPKLDAWNRNKENARAWLALNMMTEARAGFTAFNEGPKDDREVDFVLAAPQARRRESWVGPLHDEIQPGARDERWWSLGPIGHGSSRTARLLRLRLARPKANIIDAAMIAALHGAFDAARQRTDLRGVLLDAEGAHFSYGASVEEHLAPRCAQMLGALHALVLAMLEFPAPILVAVRGQCLGGGLELALAGGPIFAAPDAQFGQPEIKLGVFAPAASVLLPYRVNPARRRGPAVFRPDDRRRQGTGDRPGPAPVRRPGGCGARLPRAAARRQERSGARLRAAGRARADAPRRARAPRRGRAPVPRSADAHPRCERGSGGVSREARSGLGAPLRDRPRRVGAAAGWARSCIRSIAPVATIASRSPLTWFKDATAHATDDADMACACPSMGRHRDSPYRIQEIRMKTLLLAAALGIAVAPGFAATPEEAMTKAGCMACHSKDKKIVGPAFKDIAAKYKGQNVTAKLIEKVRKGGSGSFGPVPMTPNPANKINDADLKAAVEFVTQEQLSAASCRPIQSCGEAADASPRARCNRRARWKRRAARASPARRLSADRATVRRCRGRARLHRGAGHRAAAPPARGRHVDAFRPPRSSGRCRL